MKPIVTALRARLSKIFCLFRANMDRGITTPAVAAWSGHIEVFCFICSRGVLRIYAKSRLAPSPIMPGSVHKLLSKPLDSKLVVAANVGARAIDSVSTIVDKISGCAALRLFAKNFERALQQPGVEQVSATR